MFRKSCFIIISGVFLILLAGCGITATDESFYGIKISDLADISKTDELPAAVKFKADVMFMTFDISEAEFSKLPKEDLVSPSFLENDPNSLKQSSGIRVFGGSASQWTKMSQEFQQAQCKLDRKINLIVFDDKGDDIVVNKLLEPVELFYKDKAGNLVGESIEGVVYWRLVVENPFPSDNTVDISLTPYVHNEAGNVYRKYIKGSLKDDNGGDSFTDKPLSFGRILLVMRPGDFIFIVPDEFPIEQFSPANIFFGDDQFDTKFKMFALFCCGVID